MAFDRLQSPAVIGSLYERLTVDPGTSWIDAISVNIPSNQEVETYARLGMVPAMRQWIGGRQAKGLRDIGQTVRNYPYEATLEIPVDWMRRDKTGQIMDRVNGLAVRANTHWYTLLTNKLLAGETDLCDDGLAFFSASHLWGDSGTLSNIVSFTLSAEETIPVAERGTVASPSAAIVKTAILKGIERFYSFRDDQGEPINEGVQNFLVMVPSTLYNAALAATTLTSLERGTTYLIPNTGAFSIKVVANTRLDGQQGWVEASPNLHSFAMFATDAPFKPLIRQSEVEIEVSAQAEGSPIEFTNRMHQYGLYASRAAAYGFWGHAVKVKIV